LQSATQLHLKLETDHWLAVTDKICRGRCNFRSLNLVMLLFTKSDATEAVKAVASAIRLDCNLKHLTLGVHDGFTDEACIALAEALTVNKTLCKIILSTAFLVGDQAYEAFSVMLRVPRVNNNLILELPPFVTAGADERLHESRKQMLIEQRLNQVGREKLLASSQTTREEWFDALHELSTFQVDDSPTFQISCLYSLLRLHPAVCMS
jgi:hypothetical protein